MSDQNDALTIGRRIKSARKACKLRQSDVAQAVGVHMQTICRAIRGHAPKRDSYPKRKAPPTRR